MIIYTLRVLLDLCMDTNLSTFREYVIWWVAFWVGIVLGKFLLCVMLLYACSVVVSIVVIKSWERKSAVVNNLLQLSPYYCAKIAIY